MKKKETWYKKLTFSFLAATIVLASPAYAAAEGMKDFVAQKDNGKGKGHNEDDNSDDDTDDPEEDEDDDEEDDDKGNRKGGKGKDKENKGAEKQLEQINERLDDIEERISEATGKLDSILGGQTPSEEEPPTEEQPPVEGEEPPVEEDPTTEEPVEEEIPATEEVAAQNTDTETETNQDTAEEPGEDVTDDESNEDEESDENSDEEEQSEEEAEEEELDKEEKYESANGVRGKLISSINQLNAVEKQLSGLESKTDNAYEIAALNDRAASLKTMAQEQLDRIETAKPEKTDKEESKKEKKTKVYVDDVEVEFDQEPVVIANRTVVPLRAIFEALGAEITWDNKTQTVTATKDGVTITLKIGEKSATKNGETVALDQEAIALNGRTMVPVRFIGESFDTEVVWDQETGGIYVVE
ncbi:copper amine oxidase N-terminal domain-containing protein [Fictibacillus sp. NPDC058756]|uniref:copper amine oxidase N-terminal domain-containing protein n=1 Tax=Fictibacillus sp. NPDC058756 TaxID=3346625 RepID=UPI003697D9A5